MVPVVAPPWVVLRPSRLLVNLVFPALVRSTWLGPGVGGGEGRPPAFTSTAAAVYSTSA